MDYAYRVDSRSMFFKKKQPKNNFDPFAQFAAKLRGFEKIINEAKSKISFSGPEKFWYPYNTLASILEFDGILTGENRDLLKLIGDKPFADFGAADGDLGFFFESCGVKNVHIVDSSKLNCNRQEGAYLLKKALNSFASIHDVDLDDSFGLPEKRFGLAALLGTLYHLKNPFLALEILSRHADYCLVGTRIASRLPGQGKSVSKFPLAYLLDEKECNNDPSNFWVFTETGLKRLLTRAGWELLDFGTSGSKKSTPASMDTMQRAFCLVKSRITSN
jgi:tRNA (mo5U34)-methyltransferase